MKTAYIGTYPPRQCGIATFANNLIKSIAANTDEKEIVRHANVIALNNSGFETAYDYPEEVKLTIRQEEPSDYINAAQFVNLSDSEACVVNHEFGIFGGGDGIYLLPLLHRLKVPLIVIMHTVLREPTPGQKKVVQEIGRVASRIVVMSRKAVDFLTGIYGIPEEQIAVIEHGVPDFPAVSHEVIKKKFRFQQRKILFTFGLLSRNKGIETVLHALPQVVEKHPDLLYVVLGKTHPEVAKQSGEEYRNYLNLLVNEYRLQKNVSFLQKFVQEQELFEYLRACDIYVTPYLNEAQITSGTLAYAVGAGAAVLSTPYWHAEELLAEGRGWLFDFKDSQRLAELLNTLLDYPDRLQQLRRNAFEYGKKIRWPLIGRQYLELARSCRETEGPAAVAIEEKTVIDTSVMPRFSLEHVRRLTDDTGIVQHATYGIPKLKEGYCLDDNARALLMALMACREKKDATALSLIPVYLSYIHYMQNERGAFRNFLSFDRKFLDEVGSEDSFGRTVWALGYLIYRAPNGSYREFGKELLENSFGYFDQLTHLRGIANSIVGLSYYLKSYDTDQGRRKLLAEMAGRLVRAYENNATESWPWFESKLSYDNAILPLSLFHAAETTGDETILATAVKATRFLERVTMDKGYLSLIGSEGWYPRGGERAMFDQQAIDAMASVRLFFQAYKVTREPEYIKKMVVSYLWFLGENVLRVRLYDPETCGCCDGLQPGGVNRNQGAESTLAYLISHLTVLSALEFEFEYQQ